MVLLSFTLLRGSEALQTPGFSVAYMDRSVPPGVDFYRFADGDWLKNNPVPAAGALSAWAQVARREALGDR